jgi:hypothetical protein
MGYLLKACLTTNRESLLSSITKLFNTHFKTLRRMKPIFFLFVITASLHAAAQHQLQKIWETDTTLAIPESVLPDISNKVLYVSLINGAPWEADGKGGIGKVDLNGKIINANWITGLHAPKGLGKFGNKLYAADMNSVVVVDIAKGVVESRIKIDSAQGLNDITVTDKGIVYVSDSRSPVGNIYRIENGIASLYLSGFPGVNGLRAVGNDLYVATKEVYKVDANKNRTSIGAIDQGGDGIEPVGNGDWIGSAWVGYIYYIYADGKRDLMLDTHEQKWNTADIGYDPAAKIVYVPTFMRKSIAAYQLK